MPRSSHGKWVARVGATGGGRTYRGQVPVNWYLALVLIVVLGVGSVVYARYEYVKGPAVNTAAPLVGGEPWFAGLAFDICGTQRPPLPSNVLDSSTQSFYTLGDGVVVISPKKTGDAGTQAVLGKFVSGYQGLTLTASSIGLPAMPTPTTPTTTTPTTSTTTSTTAPGTQGKERTAAGSARAESFSNGEKCPAGTKDAGKKGTVKVGYWASAFSKSGRPSIVTGNPSTLRFTDDQLITVGFVPSGAKLPKPAGSIVTALLEATSGASTTPTTTVPTAPTTPTTTAPTSTSTTKPASG